MAVLASMFIAHLSIFHLLRRYDAATFQPNDRARDR